jgi:hypothetical protein
VLSVVAMMSAPCFGFRKNQWLSSGFMSES